MKLITGWLRIFIQKTPTIWKNLNNLDYGMFGIILEKYQHI